MKLLLKFLFAILATWAPLAVAADAPTPPQVQEQPSLETPGEQLPETAQISYKGAFVKMMLTLLGLVLLIVFTVWMLRRVAQGRFAQLNSGRALKILERRPLSAKTVLYVVQVGHKKVVVAESQLEVRAITAIDEIHHADDEE